MTQRNYETADHAVVSCIDWFTLLREGKIKNTKILNEVLTDLGELQTMEERLQRGKTEVDQNTDLSDQGRRRRLRELAEKEINPKIKRADNRIEGLTRGRENLMADIQGYEAIPDATDSRAAVREQEIRAFFRGKNAGEILKAHEKTAEAEDYETLRAIENAPRSIALEPADEIQKAKHRRLKKRYPGEMQKFEDWGDALEIYETIKRSLESRMDKIKAANPDPEGRSNFDRIKEYNDQIIGRTNA
ncbi:MAG: hypothetical protein K9J85_11770 [Desulfobacteraceae bacterium]|nr:hypothetical protein [Desulfobacteraceae bacterium]